MIDVQGVWKSYDNVTAVWDFSFTVEPKQTMGLIGPNGSGKTTLLSMISTLAKPDRGSIRVCGKDSISEPQEIRRRISFMPAEFGAPGDMSILEYMDYFACAYGIPRKSRRASIDDVMELTDLTGREEILVRSLSTGNKQRLLLAKTLLGDPELLILDEPASGLDPRARAEVRALLRELARMGKTILISSHILADLEDICDSICIIEQGKKVIAGSLDDLRNSYKTPNRIVHLRTRPEKAEEAAEHLRRLEGVLGCEVENASLTVASEQANCNFILSRLIQAEIEILEMHEERPDLEDIFLESTKGIVS